MSEDKGPCVAEALKAAPEWLREARDQAMEQRMSLNDNWRHIGFIPGKEPGIEQTCKFLGAVATAMAALQVAREELDKAVLAMASAWAPRTEGQA